MTLTHAIPVLRGTSARPLFVTAAGMPRTDAADLVRRMAGRFRLPDALRRVDVLARTGGPARTPVSHPPRLIETRLAAEPLPHLGPTRGLRGGLGHDGDRPNPSIAWVSAERLF